MGVTEILSSMGKCLSKNKHAGGDAQVLPGNIDPALKPMLRKSSSLGSFFSTGSSANLEDGEEIGCMVANGYLSKSFINTHKKRGVVELKDPIVLLYEHKMGPEIEPWYPMLEQAVTAHKPLLVIAGEGVEGEARNTLIGFNQCKGGLKWTVCAVRGPGADDADRKKHFSDLALIFGAMPISTRDPENIKKIGLAQLGTAKKVIVTANSCVVKKLDDSVFKGVEMRRVEVDELRKKSTDVDETQSLNDRYFRLEDAIGIVGRDDLSSLESGSLKKQNSWMAKLPGRSNSSVQIDENGKPIRKMKSTFVHEDKIYAQLLPTEESPQVQKVRLVHNKELLGLKPGQIQETTMEAVKYGSLSDEDVYKNRLRMLLDDGTDLGQETRRARYEDDLEGMAHMQGWTLRKKKDIEEDYQKNQEQITAQRDRPREQKAKTPILSNHMKEQKKAIAAKAARSEPHL